MSPARSAWNFHDLSMRFHTEGTRPTRTGTRAVIPSGVKTMISSASTVMTVLRDNAVLPRVRMMGMEGTTCLPVPTGVSMTRGEPISDNPKPSCTGCDSARRAWVVSMSCRRSSSASARLRKAISMTELVPPAVSTRTAATRKMRAITDSTRSTAWMRS